MWLVQAKWFWNMGGGEASGILLSVLFIQRGPTCMNLMEDGEPLLCGLAYLGHHTSSFAIHLEKARHATHTHLS